MLHMQSCLVTFEKGAFLILPDAFTICSLSVCQWVPKTAAAHMFATLTAGTDQVSCRRAEARAKVPPDGPPGRW